jgi:hypothetical protein
MENSSLRATELQRRLNDKYKVQVPYMRVYDGKELAHKQLFGSWDSNFNNLCMFKAEVERCSPGSFVVIDHHKILKQIRFNIQVVFCYETMHRWLSQWMQTIFGNR